MNKKEARSSQIIEILKEKNGATVKQLSQILNVSEMTIRRDLAVLNKNNIVNNIFGATIYNPENAPQKSEDDYELTHHMILKETEKMRIGRAAAQLIKHDDTIIIDAGTTTEMLAHHLPNHLKITALFYNINILLALKDKPNIAMIFPGGYFRPNTQMFESEESLLLIKRTRATKVFVSAAGVHKDLGITCSNGYELPTKHAIMASGLEKILLVDSSKFGSVKSAYVTHLTEFHTVITDTGIPEEWSSYIQSLGIKLICV